MSRSAWIVNARRRITMATVSQDFSWLGPRPITHAPVERTIWFVAKPGHTAHAVLIERPRHLELQVHVDSSLKVTRVIVAHRPEPIASADRVITLGPEMPRVSMGDLEPARGSRALVDGESDYEPRHQRAAR